MILVLIRGAGALEADGVKGARSWRFQGGLASSPVSPLGITRPQRTGDGPGPAWRGARLPRRAWPASARPGGPAPHPGAREVGPRPGEPLFEVADLTLKPVLGRDRVHRGRGGGSNRPL